MPFTSHTSEAVSISDTGDIVGHYFIYVGSDEYRRRGFHWKDGTFTDLGVLPDLANTNVQEVNGRGEIVGYCTNASGIGTTPFIWHDGVMTDLRTIVTLPAGYALSNVWAINNQGQMAASGLDNNNKPVGYRLTPRSKVPGDYDCNHVVDIDDLLGIIGHWGPVPGGGNAPADLNHDGTVNVADLLTVIINWTN